MHNLPPSSAHDVPSINILDADATSALSSGGELFLPGSFAFPNFSPMDAGLFPSSQTLHSEYTLLNSFSNSTSDLEDIGLPDLSSLSASGHPYMTGYGFSQPYSTVQQENATAASVDRGLSPSSFGSPAPSSASSFDSSLSPSSFYDHIPLSGSESPVSPSPATPDQPFFWAPHIHGFGQSSDSLALRPSSAMGSNDPILSLGPSDHRRTKSSPTARREPVASKAMLDANTRRRRHPATFKCDCGQTFTALFSLKRHAQSHTGERPFSCSIPGCTQRFYNSSDCKRHERSKKRHKDM